MDRQGLSQKELAQALGVRQATVSAWFQQGKLPGGATMLALPDVLKADGHWLLTGEPREPLADAAAVAELEALLARALELLRAQAGAAPVRVRAASEGEQRALDAARRFERATRKAAPRGTLGH